MLVAPSTFLQEAPRILKVKEFLEIEGFDKVEYMVPVREVSALSDVEES